MRVEDRLGKARDIVSRAGLDALLVSRPSNITYFTAGFKGGSRLLVPVDGEAIILVGGVDLTAAEQYFSGRRVQVKRIRLGEKLDDITLEVLNELSIKKLGFDELPLRTYERLRELLDKDAMTDLSEEIWALRKAKDDREIRAIRRACEVAVKGMEVAFELMEAGRTELEIAGEVERALWKAGSEEHPFNTIVASGPNSALPHARPSKRELRPGDLVVVDLGATYEGYVSDMTRTFVVGQPAAWQEEIHGLVLRAQQEAIRALRAGLKASEADSVARSIVEKAGYGSYFIHSLGHGLGLEVHEPPRLAPGSDEVLKAGYVITVEPGIYLPGRGGVRIEDTVLILEEGHEVLTAFPYGLVAGG